MIYILIIPGLPAFQGVPRETVGGNHADQA